MAVNRTFNLCVRIGQILLATVVLGVASYTLHQPREGEDHQAISRILMTFTLAVLAIVVALVMMLPFNNMLVRWLTDLLLAGAWFVNFVLLQDWYDVTGDKVCYSKMPELERLKHFANLCGKAHTTQVFSFIGAALWFISFVGGMLIWAEARWAIRRAAEDAAPAGHRRCFEMTRL